MTRTRVRIARLAAIAVVPAIVLGVFVGALASADAGTASVPAAVVNQDALVQTTGSDGKAMTVAAGRLLVTGLTKPQSSGGGVKIDWRLSNAAQAADLLRTGQVYAVVTIPAGFSRSVLSLSTAAPRRADIAIRTDDAHGYVVSQLSPVLAGALTTTLGSTLSQNVVKGLYGGYGSLKTSLVKAGKGAARLGTGGRTLADGLGDAATGADGLDSGAAQLSDGASTLAAGGRSLGAGLDKAADGARSATSGAKQLSSGLSTYAAGVDRLAAALTAPGETSAGAGLQTSAASIGQILATDTTLSAATRAELAADLQRLTGVGTALSAAAAGRQQLATQVGALATGAQRLQKGASSLTGGLRSLSRGIGTSADGARSLGSGAEGLATGADGLAAGAGSLADGLRSSATGAEKLADGARSLGTGLQSGAEKVPTATGTTLTKIARIVADPVGSVATRQHEVASPGRVVSALILPVGLWIGASAVVLLFGSVRRRLLTTGVGTGRLVLAAFVRGGALGIVQALLLIALLQLTLPLAWPAAGTAVLVAAVAAIAFFAVHQLLGTLFGRAGTVLSIVLLGLQLVAVGGLYPIEVVGGPFQVISPWLPLTAAVTAMQSVVTAAGGSAVPSGIALLLLYTVVALALTAAVTAHRRSSPAFFAPRALPAGT
ncbi:YhgE/Pip family protein [uncultured Amnibacterium sp.]|uniref:YhgE/Pip family protein n=1 Tax=uncultured Amnibacterium sp. TaxID=1631851 RepID=UPI0035CBE1BF